MHVCVRVYVCVCVCVSFLRVSAALVSHTCSEEGTVVMACFRFVQNGLAVTRVCSGE